MPEDREKSIRHYRDLEVYRKAFDAAMHIFQLTKKFPAEERYSLVTDAMQEASETQSWLEFCLACGYMQDKLFKPWMPSMRASN